MVEYKLCDYGCGQLATHQFKNGKWCCSKSYNSCLNRRVKRNKTQKSWNEGLTKETNQILKLVSEKLTGKKKPESREYMLNGGSAHANSFPRDPEKMRIRNEKIRQRMLNGQAKKMSSLIKKESNEKHRQKMLNGHAAYLNSKIKNPSKPQVELYNRVKKLYPSAELNYPCYRGKGNHSYNLDVAIPELKIYFESDGIWWHQNKDYDIKREKEIEELGWKIIRYKADYINQVPCIDKIEKDIENLKG
jgi:hypothetical protein